MWFYVARMFILERFLDSPSQEELDGCRKDDLLRIASHFEISVNKQSLKKEIKSVVFDRLVELNVLVLQEKLSVRHSVEMDAFDRSEKAEEELAPTAEVEAEASAGLPPFEPFSPMSVSSKGETRLKVRLARLQLESQEKIQARQAEMDLRLQVRKLEIEAEKQVKCDSWSLTQCELWEAPLRYQISLVSVPLPLLIVLPL